MDNRAQSTIEYVLIICLIVAALTAAQIYLKRGLQGKMRLIPSDLSGDAFYSPGAVNGDSTLTRNIIEHSESDTEETTQDNTVVTTIARSRAVQNNNRSETVLSFAEEPGR